MNLLEYFTKDLKIMCKKIEGFDSAITKHSKTIIEYSTDKFIKILCKTMSFDDAKEYFYFNIKRNYTNKNIKWK